MMQMQRSYSLHGVPSTSAFSRSCYQDRSARSEATPVNDGSQPVRTLPDPELASLASSDVESRSFSKDSSPRSSGGSKSRQLRPDQSFELPLAITYQDDYSGESQDDDDFITLEELARLVRLSKYQEQRRIQSRNSLQRSLIAAALSSRLARSGDEARRSLVQDFKAEDKKGFAILYNAVDDVKKSCDTMRRYPLLEPDSSAPRPGDPRTQESTLTENFLDDVPASCRDVLLDLLFQIRTNPEFLPSRIASLSSSELAALITGFQFPCESVLPSQSRTRVAGSSRNSPSTSSSVSRLLSFQRHDPLSALVHTCFADSAGPDSAEDRRRTDIWAAVCAELVQKRRGCDDTFIIGVLDVWTSLRDWTGKVQLEWYIIKLLQDGAFLLDKAEDQAGTRIHVQPSTANDSIATERFYESAVEGLFGLVADADSRWIPDGLLELSIAILRRLEPSLHAGMRFLLVSRYLFSDFLLKAITHPETHGMMSQYHITAYARQKILKEVALRAMKAVLDYMTKGIRSPSVVIQRHIESIMNRFQATNTIFIKARLLPAKSITSLKETTEGEPYIVISPSDLVTIVNALYPDRKSPLLRKGGDTASLNSAASSIFQAPGQLSTSTSFDRSESSDTTSIFSNSGSVYSQMASHPSLREETSYPSGLHSFFQSENEARQDEGSRVREAIRIMIGTVGEGSARGSCHPCAERWAVVFVTASGDCLTTQMLHGLGKDMEEDENIRQPSEEGNGNTEKPYSVEEFDLVRLSVLRLLEYFEVPATLGKRPSKTFSNRTSHNETEIAGRSGGYYASKSADRVDKSFQARDNASPDHLDESTAVSVNHEDERKGLQNRESKRSSNSSSVLVEMLEAAERHYQTQSDFLTAHSYWTTLQLLESIKGTTYAKDAYGSLLSKFAEGPKASILRSSFAIEEYDAWMVWLKQSQEKHDAALTAMMSGLVSLRDKMWYLTDARNSSLYETARSVAVVLKNMAANKHQRHQPQFNVRGRYVNRSGPATYLRKSEAQIYEIMAAPEDFGGPNKLSDAQSEKTKAYLSQCQVENFCQGEERIHRFNLEIENCVSKLVGESPTEFPVLWSSELYSRDKLVFENGRQKGDIVLTSLGNLSISKEFEPQLDSGRRSLRGLNASTSRLGLADLRTMSARNGSFQSFDSGRYNPSRKTGDKVDAQEAFGVCSPAMTIDSATTFWSPFQTRAQSPSTSISSQRPGSSSTMNPQGFSNTAEIFGPDTKIVFLANLKMRITALLLSDLGLHVFARGSETDAWVSGDLGQECAIRMSHEQHFPKAKSKQRVLEKKVANEDLRSANKNDGETQGLDDMPSGRIPDLDKFSNFMPRDQTGNEYPDACNFPFKDGFHKLLTMFSTHPNPFVKLDALFDLQQLIVASLAPTIRRTSSQQLSNAVGVEDGLHASFAPYNPPSGRTIDALRGRRSATLLQHHPTSYFGLHSSPDLAPLNKHDINPVVGILRDLFRDFTMLPKTLFRDLQFIAAFVPADVLYDTDKGKAFWDVGLAALMLKQDICKTIIEIADEIVVRFSLTRDPSLHKTSREVEESEELGKLPPHDMADAARMWTITAKEGNAVAERELAIFYLTHPELVERTSFPLTMPKETFKAMHTGNNGGGVGTWSGWRGEREGDRERSDPATMCVAYHWMELSAIGGDELAKKFMRQREELNALP